ncbi:probable calcium-binding protein CML36 [Nymphaea colorata]|uniref:probable calcium-binding protein CML36 n=1 Tax=Nymphaea colorata TaxID=210225 RepID=UPI00129DEB8A|nr:probable calcium-binding protein CML36 [Nymphaea colorata]
MKLAKKIPALFRSSSSKSRSPSVSRSNPSSFSSSSSSSSSSGDMKAGTPKSVLPRFPSGAWPECPPDEVHCDFTEVFRILDKDGDGKIARAELEDVLRRLGSATPAEVSLMVSLADRDGDGCITVEEFGALGQVAAGPAQGTELMDAFRVFDSDGDGRISAEELLCVLQALGDEDCTLDDCRRIIRSVDSDGDGFVGFEDFEKMMKQQRW